MSRDTFVQDLPPGISSIAEIPHDFKPRPLGQRSVVMEMIKAVAPFADFADPSWGILAKEGKFYIEVNVGNSEQLDNFAFHMSGGIEAERLIGRILRALSVVALDPQSESGLFRSPHH